MVVLSPFFQGERIRVCSLCSLVGIESKIKERTSFRYKRCVDQFCARCRGCENAAGRAYDVKARQTKEFKERRRAYERRRAEERAKDPEALRRRREMKREEARRRRLDPEKRAKILESNRRYIEKNRRNPEFLERRRENNRMSYWLRQERAGRELRWFEMKSAVEGKHGASTRRMFPIWPIREWLEHQIDLICADDANSGAVVLAERWGTNQKRMYEWRFVRETIDERWIEWIASRDGSIRPADVYPELDMDPVIVEMRENRARASACEILAWLKVVEVECAKTDR